MALKPHRSARPFYKQASYYMSEVAERGGVVVASTFGSGAGLDQSQQLATYAANPSGKIPLGVLMFDIVDVDLTRYKLNQHKSEAQKDSKVPIINREFVETNYTEGTVTPGNAYLGHSGRIISTINNNVANSPYVGRIETYPDEDGYVRFVPDLP